jgi:glyoxylase-like metal-dependent hydrolase (beta-lactamase superfamily II)
MRGRILRVVSAVAAVAALGILVNAGTLRADDDRDKNNNDNGDKHDFAGGRPGQDVPPQTLPQGFESHSDLAHDANPSHRTAQYSAWIIESSRFMRVPFRSFMPDRGDKPTVNLPVNLGIIKAANGDITLYDSGWKQLSYIYDWQFPSCCWYPIRAQMTSIGLDPDRVKRIIIGHGHWDHAGQLSEFPNAILYVQKEELKQIDFFLAYPLQFNDGHIHAVNTVERHSYRDRQDLLNGGGTQQPPPNQGCARSPVCGYPPQTLQEIFGKVLHGKAQIIDGRHVVDDGLIIHPAFRGHTYGSQLLQVNTSIGQVVFGSDTYSSWEGIRDWNVANIQQTDTIQQMLAYEKCYALTSASPLSADKRSGSYNQCIAAHEPNSYSDLYPITSNWWAINGGNCSRAAELVLSNGELSHKNGVPAYCENEVPPPHVPFQK